MNIDTYGQECPFVQVYKRTASGGDSQFHFTNKAKSYVNFYVSLCALCGERVLPHGDIACT
jgi:hypothetical protein